MILFFRASSFPVSLVVTNIVTRGVVILHRRTSVQPPQIKGSMVWLSTKMVTELSATGLLVSGCVKISSSLFTLVKTNSLSEFEPTLFVLVDSTVPSSCYRSRVKLRPRGVDLLGFCALLPCCFK